MLWKDMKPCMYTRHTLLKKSTSKPRFAFNGKMTVIPECSNWLSLTNVRELLLRVFGVSESKEVITHCRKSLMHGLIRVVILYRRYNIYRRINIGSILSTHVWTLDVILEWNIQLRKATNLRMWHRYNIWWLPIAKPRIIDQNERSFWWIKYSKFVFKTCSVFRFSFCYRFCFVEYCIAH